MFSSNRNGVISLRDRSSLLGVMIVVLAGVNIVGTPILHMPSTNRAFVHDIAAQLGTQPDFEMQIQPSQFLVKNGSNASPGLVFTPLSGFAGNVTLSAVVYPIQADAPRVSFDSSSIKLNASLPGSPSHEMIVSTTDLTAPGLYKIMVTGSSGMLSHSANATVGVTSVFVPSNSAELLYKVRFTTIAYIGGSTVLESSFEDLGYRSIEITNLTVTSDIGIFNINQCGAPVCVIHNAFHPYVSLSPFTEQATRLTIQIPNFTEIIGTHSVTITISWVLDEGNFSYQSAPDLVVNDDLEIYSRPSNPTPNNTTNIPNGLLRLVPPILGGITMIAVLTAGLAFWNGRRSEKRNLAMLQYVASAKESLTQKTCTNCGTKAAFEAKFCGNCGHMFY